MRPFGVAVIAPLRPLDVIRLHVQFCIDGARPKWWRSPALSNAQLPLVEALTAAFGLHPHVTAVSADRSVVHAARTQTAAVGPRELLSDVADRPLPNALRISRIPPHANVAALLAPCVTTGRVPAQMWAQSRSRCGRSCGADLGRTRSGTHYAGMLTRSISYGPARPRRSRSSARSMRCATQRSAMRLRTRLEVSAPRRGTWRACSSVRPCTRRWAGRQRRAARRRRGAAGGKWQSSRRELESSLPRCIPGPRFQAVGTREGDGRSSDWVVNGDPLHLECCRPRDGPFMSLASIGLSTRRRPLSLCALAVALARFAGAGALSAAQT